MIWVAKNLYFFNCLLDGAHTKQRGSAELLHFGKSRTNCIARGVGTGTEGQRAEKV